MSVGENYRLIELFHSVTDRLIAANDSDNYVQELDFAEWFEGLWDDLFELWNGDCSDELYLLALYTCSRLNELADIPQYRHLWIIEEIRDNLDPETEYNDYPPEFYLESSDSDAGQGYPQSVGGSDDESD